MTVTEQKKVKWCRNGKASKTMGKTLSKGEILSH